MLFLLWMVVVKGFGYIRLFFHKSSFNMKNIQLPQTHLRIKSYVPSCHPNEPNSLFFFICEDNFILVWLRNESEFAIHDIELEDEDDNIKVTVHYERRVYGLTYFGMKLVVMKDYKGLPIIQFENSIIEESLQQYVRHLFLPSKTYMVTSGDELMVVIQTYSHFSYTSYSNGRVLDFQIFRANFTKRTWEEMNNIDDRIIFLSSREGTISVVTLSRMRVKMGLRVIPSIFLKEHVFIFLT